MLMSAVPGMPRSLAKKVVLSALYGGSFRSVMLEAQQEDPAADTADSLPVTLPEGEAKTFLQQLRSDCHTLYNVLRSSQEEADVVEFLEKHPKPGNSPGRLLAHVYCKYEARVLEAVREKLVAEGYSVGCLIFDGLLVERKAAAGPPRGQQGSRPPNAASGAAPMCETDESEFSEDDEDNADAEEGRDTGEISDPHRLPLSVLRVCEQHVKTKLGFDIALLEKPLAPTQDDVARLDGAVNLDQLRPFERFVTVLTRNARINKLRRQGDKVSLPNKKWGRGSRVLCFHGSLLTMRAFESNALANCRSCVHASPSPMCTKAREKLACATSIGFCVTTRSSSAART